MTDYATYRSLLASAARTTSSQTDWINVSAYERVTIYVDVTVKSGSSPVMQLYVDESPDESASYQVDDFMLTDITKFRISTTEHTRFIRLRYVISGTSASFTFSADMIGKALVVLSDADSASITLVRRRLKITDSDELLTDTEISNNLDDAVLRYSRDKPREITHQFYGRSVYDYDLQHFLSDWVNDFSAIREIEFPAEDQTEDIQEDIDWKIYKPDETAYTLGTASSGGTTVTMSTAAEAIYFKDDACVYISDNNNNEINWVNGDGNTTTGVVTLKNALSDTYDTSPTVKRRRCLRFVYDEPVSTDIVRVRYTTKHTLDDDTNTIPDQDYPALLDLAASFSALAISADFSKNARSSISADSIDYVDKAREWQRIADEYYKKYMNHLGLEQGETLGASYTQDNDTFFQWGTDYLFHPRRWR